MDREVGAMNYVYRPAVASASSEDEMKFRAGR